MYTTKLGDFDGNQWEAFCQICFKQKYLDEGYQEIKAWVGDMGIEGYTTKSNKVFQCYCPEKQYTDVELYEKLRDKITTDLKKIIKNQTVLQGYLTNNTIEYWIFVTPSYNKHEILAHCKSKTDEYRSKNIPILHENFQVLIHDIEFYSDVLPIALGSISKKLNIQIPSSFTKETVIDWKAAESSSHLLVNAGRKNELLIPEDKRTLEKINLLTEKTVKDYLRGSAIMDTWANMYKEQYEKFIEIITLFEEKVEELCIISSDNPEEIFKSIKYDLEIKLKEEFPRLESVMIDYLKNMVVADWILRCPLDFE